MKLIHIAFRYLCAIIVLAIWFNTTKPLIFEELLITISIYGFTLSTSFLLQFLYSYDIYQTHYFKALPISRLFILKQDVKNKFLRIDVLILHIATSILLLYNDLPIFKSIILICLFFVYTIFIISVYSAVKILTTNKNEIKKNLGKYIIVFSLNLSFIGIVDKNFLINGINTLLYTPFSGLLFCFLNPNGVPFVLISISVLFIVGYLLFIKYFLTKQY